MKLTKNALRCSIAAAAIAVSSMAAATPTMAQNGASAEKTYTFSIPAQDMKSALRAFARASGQQIVFDDKAVANKRAPALVGAFTATRGVERLLAGSGLDATRGRSGVIVVRPSERGVARAQNNTASLAAQTQPTGEPGQGGAAVEEAPEETEILVTGSRIQRQVAADSPVPIIGINQEDIQAAGATELSEILADYPAVTAGDSLSNSNSGINQAGLSTVDLRGLGANRTLTLIDGRRTVSNRITQNAVSLSTIPTMFVERVEIITGGASAVYGSDAVAGVVNIITRKKFDGVRVGGRAGLSTYGDGQRINLDVLAGQSFFDDRVSLVLGGSYEKEDGVMGRQRKRSLESISYSQSADTDPENQGDLGINRPNLSSSIPGGRFLSSRTAGGGYYYYDPEGNPGRATNTADYGWETRPDRQLFSPRTSYLAAGQLTIDLGSNIEFFAQGQYSKIKTASERGGAETAASGAGFGVADEFSVRSISRNNPFVPAEILAAAGTSSSIAWSRRFTELGHYRVLNDRETVRAWTGLRGDLGSDWNWEVSYGYGRFNQIQDRVGLINYNNLNYALQAEYDPAAPGDITRVRCVDATARANGCVPINLFGPGSITPEAAEYIGTTMKLDAVMRQDVVQGFVSGSLVELPAGPLSVALGAEYRKDKQHSTTDDVTRLGYGSASFIAEYSGNIKAKEAFAEISIPLLRDQPFAEQLTVDGAIRVGDYNITNVGSVLSYRFGGEWAPTEDIRFRTQYARAQRAPTVTNLYSPLRDDADEVVDLCNGVTATTDGTIAANCRSIPAIAAAIAADGSFTQLTENILGPSAGNPDLKEETADTLSIGGVLTPRFLPGLTMTVDYFKIKIKDAISSLGPDELLRECLGNPEGLTNNYFCDQISRDADGQITRIINEDLNLNRIVRSGVDVAVDYRFDAPQWLSENGRFDMRLLYSRLLDFYTEFEGVDGVQRTDNKGEIGNWKHTGQFQLGYRDDGFRLRWKTRYTGKGVDSNQRLAVAQTAESRPPYLWVGDRWKHDIYASVEMPTDDRELRLYAGVNNLFNSKSPFMPNGTVSGSSTNFTGEYDEMGRYFYVGFEANF